MYFSYVLPKKKGNRESMCVSAPAWNCTNTKVSCWAFAQSCSGLSDWHNQEVLSWRERKDACSPPPLPRPHTPHQWRGTVTHGTVTERFGFKTWKKGLNTCNCVCTETQGGKKVFLEAPVQKELSDKQGDVVQSRAERRIRNTLSCCWHVFIPGWWTGRLPRVADWFKRVFFFF